MGVQTPFVYRFTVDHVYDGDTVMGKLDLGLGIYLGGLPSINPSDHTTFSIRMYGINAPELNSVNAATRAEAFASRDNLRELLPAGVEIRVVSMGWDKYGMRIDAIPYTVDGVDCCQAQLDGGFAVTYP
jgi:endonuclease YncB( thermonuclease family)